MSSDSITPHPMSEENKEALIQYVVRELVKGHPKQNVIEDLCRQYGW